MGDPRGGRWVGALRVLTVLIAVATGCSRPQPGSGPESGAASSTGPQPSSTSSQSRTPGTGPRSGFVAFGDFGTGNAAQRDVAGAMRRWAADGHRVDALVTTGDNVYPSGQPASYRHVLNEPYAALRRPMWATLGNHDVAAGHGDRQLRYLGLPALPYARRLPTAELLFLDANRVDITQSRWLEARLAAPGPAYRIVVFHQPAWSCSKHGSTAAVDRQWVPILERHRVTLVLNGHDHNYQRFTSRRGVTYIVTGGGGAALYPVRSGCAETPKRAAAAVRHHFVAVEITGTTLTVTAVDADGTVIDRVTRDQPDPHRG